MQYTIKMYQSYMIFYAAQLFDVKIIINGSIIQINHSYYNIGASSWTTLCRDTLDIPFHKYACMCICTRMMCLRCLHRKLLLEVLKNLNIDGMYTWSKPLVMIFHTLNKWCVKIHMILMLLHRRSKHLICFIVKKKPFILYKSII